MQKIRSQKSLKNFYIRPTTGVGSKGAFSVEKRDNHSNRDMKNINDLFNNNNNNYNNNNVLFQVNSYGFKPTTASQIHDKEHQQNILMSRSEALTNKRQSYTNSDNNNNQLSDDFRILVKNKVFSGTANFSTSNNPNQKKMNLNLQSNNSQKSSPSSQIQLSQQYRIHKLSSQEQLKESNPFYDEGRRNTMNNHSKGSVSQKISSPINQQSQSQQYLNGYVKNPKQQPSSQRNYKGNNNDKTPFEDDISVIKPDDNEQDQQNNKNDSMDSDYDQDKENNAQSEQISNIMTKEINNLEDSMNDIQELATDGFDILIFNDELKQQQQSPLQKFYNQVNNKPPQVQQNLDKNQTSKGRFVQDSHDNSETNHSDMKRFSSLQKNLSGNQYNFTQSKLSEQKDETIPSVHQNTNTNNQFNTTSKENHLQLINIQSEMQENRISRPITSQNNVSRIKNLQMQSKYNNNNNNNNMKQTSNNFYDLFANQNNPKMNNFNVYTNQLLSTIPLKQSSKIPFFHNYYRNEQIKNLQQTNTFSVKKAQIFSFQPKHNNLMSRQGQRKDSAQILQQNTMSSQLQQQLIQGITNSNNNNNNNNIKSRQMFSSGNSNSKL